MKTSNGHITQRASLRVRSMFCIRRRNSIYMYMYVCVVATGRSLTDEATVKFNNYCDDYDDGDCGPQSVRHSVPEPMCFKRMMHAIHWAVVPGRVRSSARV